MTNEVSQDMLVKDAAGNFSLPESADATATSQTTIIDTELPYRDMAGNIRFPEIPEKHNS